MRRLAVLLVLFLAPQFILKAQKTISKVFSEDGFFKEIRITFYENGNVKTKEYITKSDSLKPKNALSTEEIFFMGLNSDELNDIYFERTDSVIKFFNDGRVHSKELGEKMFIYQYDSSENLKFIESKNEEDISYFLSRDLKIELFKNNFFIEGGFK